jgi:DNA-binding MarR family transcriptional regulator
MPPVDTGTAARELLQVVTLVMRALAADMRRWPNAVAPAQMGMLKRVSMSPCTMSSLARHLAVSLPTISKSVEMLVRRGWLERWIDKRDRRQTMVRLTPQGRKVLAGLKKRAEQHVQRRLAPLSAAEREQLVSALKVLAPVLAGPGAEDE